jgi:sugar phosphate isomerase/epimerase
MTRRDFGKSALAALPAAACPAAALAAPNSKIDGVQIGVISYSFRGMPQAEIIPAMVKIGLNEVELMSGDAEVLAGAPPGQRASGIDAFPAVRKKFSNAGIDLRILCFNMPVTITDENIDYAFQMAKALGVRIISSSSTLTVARRVAPVADKYKIMWAAHGHDNIRDPEQFATPEVFAKVLAMGDYMRINLDIGHFTAAGFDPLAYIRENHAHITNLHIKDRKKSPAGQMTPIKDNNFPWGEGDTPIKDVLQLLKKEKYGVPANIEYEYNARAAGDPVTEVARCYDYIKKALQW